MSARDDIWRFTVTNPDYWPLFQRDDDAPEVAGLADDEREAFNAAKEVARSGVESQLRACWAELARRADGTAFGRMMPANPWRATILAGKMNSSLPDYKGSIYVSVWDCRGTLAMWATLYVAKMRQADAREAWGEGESVYRGPDGSLSVWHHIDLGRSEAENAARLVDDAWPRLSAWLTDPTTSAGATRPSVRDPSAVEELHPSASDSLD